MIDLKHINKTYYAGSQQLHILKNINMSIREGDFVAIMGPSGSGKSTLLNLIGCLDFPSEGEYYFDNENLFSKSNNELAKFRNEKIGFIFQHFHLIPRINVLENIKLPMVYSEVRPSIRHKRGLKLLEDMGLTEWKSYMPNKLSGGQKQRIAIARAIVNEPKLIIADEPTGALDTKTSDKIMRILKKLNEGGTTIILVTHEEDIASYSDYIIQLRDGSV